MTSPAPPPESPSLGDLLIKAAERAWGDMVVGLPATVVAVGDDDTITARVSVRGRFENVETDELEPVTFPDVQGVPVQYPGSVDSNGDGVVITWPILVGSHVWLRPSDRSLDEWRSGRPLPTTPRDVRRFDLTDAVAVPAFPTGRQTLPSTAKSSGLVLNADDIKLGSGAATEFVALANLVLDRLETIRTTYNGHTHTDPVSGSTGPPSDLLPLIPFASVAADKVRAE